MDHNLLAGAAAAADVAGAAHRDVRAVLPLIRMLDDHAVAIRTVGVCGARDSVVDTTHAFPIPTGRIGAPIPGYILWIARAHELSHPDDLPRPATGRPKARASQCATKLLGLTDPHLRPDQGDVARVEKLSKLRRLAADNRRINVRECDPDPRLSPDIVPSRREGEVTVLGTDG